ncbi:MAG: outer membrane beta-barrel protein [Oleiphilaceae bacterium]|jgi:outer membrane beta-barrel protein
METRSQRIFLKPVIASILVVSSVFSHLSQAQDRPLIEPDVEPVVIKEALIDSENFEIGGFFGTINIEDFESSLLYGVRLAYHLSEDVFFEANYGFADAGETSAEQLGQVQILTNDARDYTFYNVNVAYNILPGQAYFARRYAFNTNFYLILGLGATEFADDNRLTINYGAGYQVLLNDVFAWHLSARQHMYKIDLLGEEKNAINTELSTGISIFF